MIAVVAVVWITTIAVVDVGVARVARHRAQSAADLSALAAAARAASALEDACARARTVAIANGARVHRCSISDGIATVSVSMRFALPVLGSRTAVAAARAGPVGAKP
jgi:secretion/DNA translocation related TadE-like protein